MKAIINWVKRNWPVSKATLLTLETELRVKDREINNETAKNLKAIIEMKKDISSLLESFNNHQNQIFELRDETAKNLSTVGQYVVSEFLKDNTPKIAEGESYNEWTVTNVSVNSEDWSDVHYAYTLKFDEKEVVVKEISKQAIQEALNG